MGRMTGFFKRVTFGLIRRFMELKGQKLRGVLKADNVTQYEVDQMLDKLKPIEPCETLEDRFHNDALASMRL